MSAPSSFSYRSKARRFGPLVRSFLSFLAALIGGLLLFASNVNSGLTSTGIEIGLDPLRAQLITALVLTMGSALVGAFVGRRKLGTLVGAGVVFWFDYLASFIKLQLQPTYDPGGHLELLNTGALVDTSIVLMALALLCAFIGAAVGMALSNVLLDPFYLLLRTAFLPANRHFTNGATGTTKTTMTGIIGSWLGVIAMVTLIVLASNASNLFLFSPDVGLHTLPKIGNGKIPSHGTIVQDSLVSSALKGQHKSFVVYLPPSYNIPQGKHTGYPVLYLLHGSPGQDTDWFTGGKANESADTLIATGKIPELIMVSPDGNGRPGAPSEWGNSFDQQQMIETYVTRDLVNYVDRHYRTIADSAHRAIGGLSMGGFGAMNIAVHHPDVFGTVIALGGYYRADGAVWGGNPTYIQANSPADVFPRDPAAWKLHIYLGAATNDQPYYDDTKQFMQELDTQHVAYRFDLQKGYHSWNVWQAQLYNALTWLRWG